MICHKHSLNALSDVAVTLWIVQKNSMYWGLNVPCEAMQYLHNDIVSTLPGLQANKKLSWLSDHQQCCAYRQRQKKMHGNTTIK